MKIKTILQLSILSIAIAVTFTACGNDGGNDASFSNAQTKDSIDVNCTTPATINTYLDLYSGDTIVKIDENASISIYHDINGTKKVCKETGSSYILRAN